MIDSISPHLANHLDRSLRTLSLSPVADHHALSIDLARVMFFILAIAHHAGCDLTRMERDGFAPPPYLDRSESATRHTRAYAVSSIGGFVAEYRAGVLRNAEILAHVETAAQTICVCAYTISLAFDDLVAIANGPNVP